MNSSHETSNMSDSDSNSSEMEKTWLYAVHTKNKGIVSAHMQVNGCDVLFQIDSAAETNTICQRYVRKEQVSMFIRS